MATQNRVMDSGVQRVLEVGSPLFELSLAQRMDYFVAQALGQVPGVSAIRYIGHNLTVAALSTEVLWFPSIPYVFPTTDTVCGVSSNSINDVNTTGTGVWLVALRGLDISRNIIAEVVALNGLGVVNTVQLFYRFETAFIIDAGSQEVNDGDITFTIDGNTVGTIEATIGFVAEGVFPIPAGMSLTVETVFLSVGKNDEASISLVSRTPTLSGGFTRVTIGPILRYFQQSGGTQYPYMLDAPQEDIIVEVTNHGQGSIEVTGGFFGALNDNSLLV